MSDPTPSERITELIAGLPDWRGKLVGRLRALVLEAAPGLTEEWKWETPVWGQQGLVCSVGVFKDHVKVNFFRGASLEDPRGLFNAGLEAKATRAIDFHQGERIDGPGLKALVRAAAALNASKGKRR